MLLHGCAEAFLTSIGGRHDPEGTRKQAQWRKPEVRKKNEH
jgi:hypothetical protein